MESHVYALRDTGPAGGLIFYVDDVDEFSWDYLEAAPSDQSSGVLWSNGSNIVTGATGTVIGTGSANTEAIITNQGVGTYAAQLCADLTIGNYSDWFLPSGDEYILMHEELHTYNVGGFSETGGYWTSSEVDVDSALGMSFRYCDQHSGNKSVHLDRVRAARAF